MLTKDTTPLNMGLASRDGGAFIAKGTNAASPFCLFPSNNMDQKEIVLQEIKMFSSCFTIKHLQDDKEGPSFNSVLKVITAERHKLGLLANRQSGQCRAQRLELCSGNNNSLGKERTLLLSQHV